MYRVRTVFTGVTGSPWYSNIYFQGGGESQPSSGHEAVTEFWDGLAQLISQDVQWQVEGDMPVINPVTGEITDYVGVPATESAGANVTNLVPLANQILIRLRTGSVRAGRRVQGKIFVPGTCINLYDDQGQVLSSVTGVANLASEALRTSEGGGLVNGLAVWSRPREAVGITIPGLLSLVTSTDTPTEPAVLRSRRD